MATKKNSKTTKKTSPSAKKTTKPVLKKAVKKTVKKSSLKLILPIILVVIALVVGVSVYAHVSYNDQYKDDVERVEVLKSSFTSLIGTEITNDLDYGSLIENYEGLKITINSNKENIINNNGIVTRPLAASANATVELEVVMEIIPDNAFASLYYKVLGKAKIKFKVTVIVLKAELTTEEKLDIIESQLYLPSYTVNSISLVDEILIFDGVTISWSSNEEEIITSTGLVLNTGHAGLTATVKLNDITREIVFPIEVKADYGLVEEAFEDFSGVVNTSGYATEKNINGFKITQAVVDDIDGDKFIKLRMPDNPTIEYLKELENVMEVSFDYWAVTSSSFSKEVKLIIEYSINDGETWQSFQDQIINDNDKQSIALNFSFITGKFRVRVRGFADYSTMLVAVDNIKISREFNKDDLAKAFSDIIPTSFKDSYILPLSSPFGGKVSWHSDKESLLSSKGVVNLPEDTEYVELTATVTNIWKEYDIVFLVKVVGTNYTLPVEVFFIDIGKYGTADPGESIYFKIGDIDILVDAGDNITTTKQAVSEVIDANSEDGIIEYLIATHPDADHIGGMKHIFDTYEIKNVIYFEGTHTTNLYNTFKEAIANEDGVSECTILQAYNNEGSCKRVIELAPDVKIEFVDTGYYSSTEPNGRSIVFVFEAYGTRILMTGDADNGHGRTLEANYMHSVGNIDILKIVHHGTREGTTSEFLAAVDPEYVIITNGNYLGNKHGHPTHEAINRVYGYDRNIFIFAVTGGGTKECEYTTSYKCSSEDSGIDRNGTIRILIDGSGFEFSAENNGGNMIELSSTHYWINHPLREYSHGN